jgi:phosphoribosylaminoimidazole (AIR) synthetase
MLRTFNMGLGMVAVVDRGGLEACTGALEAVGAGAAVVGRVERRDAGGPRVRFER